MSNIIVVISPELTRSESVIRREETLIGRGAVCLPVLVTVRWLRSCGNRCGPTETGLPGHLLRRYRSAPYRWARHQNQEAERGHGPRLTCAERRRAVLASSRSPVRWSAISGMGGGDRETGSRPCGANREIWPLHSRRSRAGQADLAIALRHGRKPIGTRLEARSPAEATASGECRAD